MANIPLAQVPDRPPPSVAGVEPARAAPAGAPDQKKTALGPALSRLFVTNLIAILSVGVAFSACVVTSL
jgi:hypothetical protein